MPWYSAINLAGLLTVAGYTGFVATASRFPWAALASAILFLIAFLLPVIREYRKLSTGFQNIEADYLSNRQREDFPPKQEILVSPPSPLKTTPSGSPLKAIILLGICGFALLGFDVVDLVINAPPSPTPNNTISNF